MATDYTGEDLVSAVHRLNAVANYGGLPAKQQAVAVLEGVAGGLCAAVQVLAFDLRHAGYGPEVTDGVYGAGRSFQEASNHCGEAKGALDSLASMTLGELASSQRQTPHNTELNGSH